MELRIDDFTTVSPPKESRGKLQAVFAGLVTQRLSRVIQGESVVSVINVEACYTHIDDIGPVVVAHGESTCALVAMIRVANTEKGIIDPAIRFVVLMS